MYARRGVGLQGDRTLLLEPYIFQTKFYFIKGNVVCLMKKIVLFINNCFFFKLTKH